MKNNKEILRVNHLKKYFNTNSGLLHAVDDVTFAIKEGQTLGVVGESGCGKSTIGKTIMRLHEATSGEILFKGENILKYNKSRMKRLRSEIQMVFQDPYESLNPRATISQTIADPLVIQGKYKKNDKKGLQKKVKEMMELVGLSSRLVNTYPHELDGGRRQRVGIARALALNPVLVICDEPVSALDVSIQAQILNLMQDLQDELGLTYMFITHNLAVVKHLSDDIIVMYLGQLVEKSSTKKLFENPMHPYTQALLSAIPITDPDYKTNRILLKGELSSPINPQPGCRFSKRCLYTKKECFRKNPELREIDSNHYVACHLFNGN